jgi:hypothetical protein
VASNNEHSNAIPGDGVSSPGAAARGVANSRTSELAKLFLGVLGGILSEKLVRSIGATYEITLEDVEGTGESLLFYLDLKNGLGRFFDLFDYGVTIWIRH